MTAGVHHPFVLRRKLKPRLFRDGKSVHVGPEHHRLSRCRPLQEGDNTGIGNRHRIETEIPEVLQHDFLRPHFLKSKFRMTVEVPPQRYKFIVQFSYPFLDIHFHTPVNL
ncbi:MAG TPA: hypothetical protein VK966_01585 [Longimicrobiales bacterium]|nr:hypothetical protein [Longimicrobiales bacterium]